METRSDCARCACAHDCWVRMTLENGIPPAFMRPPYSEKDLKLVEDARTGECPAFEDLDDGGFDERDPPRAGRAEMTARIKQSGNSLVIVVSREARMMGLGRGDLVDVSISPARRK